MSERIVRDYALVSDLKYVILRYFNVAGAEVSGSLGKTQPAHHLIAAACDAALGKIPQMSIFGTDFDTPDGTGIRDYIHVDDLARAHLDALIYLDRSDSVSQILNCGYGQGYSVREVIEKVKQISGVNFTVIEAQRRAGDPACVIAGADRIAAVLGWQPRFNDLDLIVRTALAWEKKLQSSSVLAPKLVGNAAES